MNINQDTLKTILNTFIDSPRSSIWIADLEENGIEIDDSFLFHMQILEDQQFIECLDKQSNLGYEIQMEGAFTWQSRPLRLTATGHAFIEAVNRPEIWELLQKEFKHASLSTLKTVGADLLSRFAKKQIKQYFES